MIRVPNTCPQRGAERFERNSRLPRDTFAYEGESYPSISEALMWAFCALLMVLLFSMAMGADVFKILRMVA